MAAPSVYAAIVSVAAEFGRSGIAKSRTNEQDGYKYRSIDDILERLSPLLAAGRLCVLPRVVERTVVERSDEGHRLVLNVAVRVAFTIVSADDASSHVVEAFGEALDPGDKATAKAMSAAYKSAMIQTFCIPLSGAEDPDTTSYRLRQNTHSPEPVGGWEQWAQDTKEIVLSCESDGAVELVQCRNRELLKALSRERSDLYDELGQTFSERRRALAKGQKLGRQIPRPGQAGRKIKPVSGAGAHSV